ncbi:MAG: arylsulfatase [Bacteroidales bacterium]|nr:arylsulfatase [Bacteroidales bacterium]
MRTKTNWILAYILVFISLFAGSETILAKSNNSKPNIVFILADDLGWGDLSCLGQKNFQTPHLDKLASDGLLMTNFHTGSTVCAPSRAALMTGRHTGHNTVRSNKGGYVLRDDEITIAEILKKQGYATGCIGKWGVGSPKDMNDPERNGIDYFYGYVGMGHAHNLFPEFLYRNGEKVFLNNKLRLNEDGSNPWLDKSEGMGVSEIRNDYAPFLFDKEALQFIERNKNNPFFLYLAYNTPHANNEDPVTGCEVPDYGEFKDKDWPDVEKGFAKMVTNLDNSVGMVEKKLKELGLDENTIVFFCSDNGPHQEGGHEMEYFNSNGDLLGMKRDLYEGGIRTPLIVKWKGVIKPNTKDHHLSAFWDVLPTFCDIAGANYPKEIDGVSFLPTITGKGKQKKHDFLYWEFYPRGGLQALIQDNWKAIRFNLNNGKEREIKLYNLKDDPEEKIDVSNEHRELVKKFELLFEKARDDNYGIKLFTK